MMSSASIVAGIVAQLEKRLDVGMPGFEINAGCAFALRRSAKSVRLCLG
jgi:hypothetical protein